MTVFHRRTLGILGGRTSAAIAVFRELQQYHKSNGVEYELQLPFGGESMRMALAARFPSVADVQKYFLKVMADQAFLDLAAKNAQNVISGSSRDDLWRQVFGPAQPSAGALMHARIMGVLPGRLTYSAGIMKELIDYLAANGVGYVGLSPFAVGDPMRAALAARFAGAGELDAFSTKIMADPKWQEIVARNAFNLVPGSRSDHMWITI